MVQEGGWLKALIFCPGEVIVSTEEVWGGWRLPRAPRIAILLALSLPCALLSGQELGVAQDKNPWGRAATLLARTSPDLTLSLQVVPECPCSAGFCKETLPLSLCVPVWGWGLSRVLIATVGCWRSLRCALNVFLCGSKCAYSSYVPFSLPDRGESAGKSGLKGDRVVLEDAPPK